MRNHRRFLILAVAVALMVGVVAGVEAAHPGILAEQGLDFWSLPALSDDLRTEEENQTRFEKEIAVARLRLALKQEIFEGLLGGKLTLSEAARDYLNVDPSMTAHRKVAGLSGGPIPSDAQLATRAVLAGAKAILSDREDPTGAARIAALEAEASAGDL